MYIAIDGDDVGRKITSSYLSNSEERLTYISNKLNDTTKKKYLKCFYPMDLR